MQFWIDKEQKRKNQMLNGKMHMSFQLTEKNIVRFLPT